MKNIEDFNSFLNEKLTPKIQALINEIKDDLDYFRPGGYDDKQGPEISYSSYNKNILASIELHFRYLGNWELPYDVEDEEDNDNEEWVRGEYKKYNNKFESWIKDQSWYTKNKKKLEFSVQTGEKNWAYFLIEIKK